MLTDPISDYLTRVRNALRADHPDVEVPASRLKKEVTRILNEQGYISDYAVEPTAVGEVIRIQLTLHRGPPAGDHRHRAHLAAGPAPLHGQDRGPPRQGGMGTAIVSTSTGVMTGHEAKAKGVGGEVVAYVW